MPQVTSISGLGKTSSELLDAIGVSDIESLAGADVDELVRELERANGILKIAKRAPHRADVVKWISSARSLQGERENAPAPAEPVTDEAVNYEALADVREMLIKAPIAVPLPVSELMARQIAVADIPRAILLNSVMGDLNVRTTATPALVRASRPQVQGYVRLSESSAPRRELDISRIRSVAELRTETLGRTDIPAPVATPASLLRAPREETNIGRDPHSRRYIRGVLHNHPLHMLLAAWATLSCYILVPFAVSAGILLLLSQQMPGPFSWVPEWFLVFPLLLPVFGVLYAVLAPGSKCRICGQRLFVHRQCRKNDKSHHVRGIGYIIPLCLHVILFRWFRCTYCGTPVRLKE